MSNFKDMVNKLLDEDFYYPKKDSTYMKVYEVDKKLFEIINEANEKVYPEMQSDLIKVHEELMEILKKMAANSKSEQSQM